MSMRARVIKPIYKRISFADSVFVYTYHTLSQVLTQSLFTKRFCALANFVLSYVMTDFVATHMKKYQTKFRYVYLYTYTVYVFFFFGSLLKYFIFLEHNTSVYFSHGYWNGVFIQRWQSIVCLGNWARSVENWISVY